MQEKITVFTIGNFDGIHKGHQKILEATKKVAKELTSSENFGVITFEPHPYVFFNKVNNNFLLTNLEDKINILKSYGVKEVLVFPFKDFYQKNAESFIRYLVEKYNIKALITGENFSLGCDKIKDIKDLNNILQNYNIRHQCIELLEENGEIVSSSFIRNKIKEGDLSQVSNYLGRNFIIEGEVIHGRKLARTLGYPTANILPKEYVSLKYGVYGVKVFIDNEEYFGIANFGLRPTVKGNDKEEVLETHIFRFNQDIYHQKIKVEFLLFIREEKKFQSIEILKENIIKDIDKVKHHLKI